MNDRGVIPYPTPTLNDALNDHAALIRALNDSSIKKLFKESSESPPISSSTSEIQENNF
ncbi:uncharacterized protein CELE_Y53C12A.6 [Caenorhabditis elegans]|nr:Uncharacterized protein CELE_Y53C12A.6 [Caenorhabditis elegans]CBZ01805.1 Uncharacterized protein CELE_Y53C12A.6 [Caenorhabditis elegans]|eukprot:NP_001254224.1 Uncharacterized protein CELE_Y53C12A.6 [Caenorhabditis elegans]